MKKSTVRSLNFDMIEDHTRIDTITRSKDGRIELVIMDAGETTDPEQRFSHLTEKLKAYVYYIVEGEFKKDFPDKGIHDVAIRVMCRIPPTERMSGLTRLCDPSDPKQGIDIFYQHFPGDHSAPSGQTATSASGPSPGQIASSPKGTQQRSNYSEFRIGRRHLLLPIVLWLYRREPMESRGQFLHSFGYELGDRAIEIIYGRFEGFRYGHFRFSADPPHILIERADGLKVSHSFFDDSDSALEFSSEGILGVRRSGKPLLQICHPRGVDMVQLISGVLHQLPNELKKRLVLPEIAEK